MRTSFMASRRRCRLAVVRTPTHLQIAARPLAIFADCLAFPQPPAARRSASTPRAAGACALVPAFGMLAAKEENEEAPARALS